MSVIFSGELNDGCLGVDFTDMNFKELKDSMYLTIAFLVMVIDVNLHPKKWEKSLAETDPMFTIILKNNLTN